MAPIQVYKSLDSVLKILEENKFLTGVVKLLEIYHATKNKTETNHLAEVKLYSLIVVEGLDACGKTTLTRELSAKIGAELLCTPPKCIQRIRDFFDADELLRAAYYALGNYIAAMEIAFVLRKKPVVLDRFWHSTSAYAEAQKINEYPEINKELPKAGNENYQWPKDLLKPDIVIFLNVTEEVRLERVSRRSKITAQEMLLHENHEFRENVIQAYKNMENPSIIIINGDPPIKEVLEDMYHQIKHLL